MGHAVSARGGGHGVVLRGRLSGAGRVRAHSGEHLRRRWRRRGCRRRGDTGGDSVSDVAGGDGGPPISAVPRAVTVARATAIPDCTVYVDAAASAGDGSAASPFKSIAAAVASAADGAVICVAEGTYPESLAPGVKPLTLAGGFRSGQLFAVRDSSLYVSKAQGAGAGSFVRIEDPGPTEGQLTAIDGFEITGYSQAIYRDIYYGQRFDITTATSTTTPAPTPSKSAAASPSTTSAAPSPTTSSPETPAPAAAPARSTTAPTPARSPSPATASRPTPAPSPTSATAAASTSSPTSSPSPATSSSPTRSPLGAPASTSAPTPAAARRRPRA
jgi:hypothetical protein